MQCISNGCKDLFKQKKYFGVMGTLMKLRLLPYWGPISFQGYPEWDSWQGQIYSGISQNSISFISRKIVLFLFYLSFSFICHNFFIPLSLNLLYLPPINRIKVWNTMGLIFNVKQASCAHWQRGKIKRRL